MLDTDLMRTFVAICETGSFRAAAARVHRTPGAISMQMKRLDETLGRSLFERDGRNMRLTHDGEALLSDARRMIALDRQIMERFHAPECCGQVRFGAPDDYGTRWLPAILTRFARRLPGVEVSVEVGPSSAMIDRLDAGTLDIALVTNGTARDHHYEGLVLHREPLVWIGAVGGIARLSSPLPLALAGATCTWRRSATDALDADGIAHRTLFMSEHSAGQIAAVKADLAVAPLPLSCIAPGLERVGALPSLPDYDVRLIVGADPGSATRALAEEARKVVGADINPS